MNTQFSELSIHSHMYARTIAVYTVSKSPESNSALHSHLDCNWREQTVLYTPILSVNLKKITVNSHKQYENITYEFIAYWTQRSILFCCTETNNILRASSSSEVAVFSMRTFTWSWWLPASLCRSAIGLNVEPYGLRFGTRSTSTCLRSRHLHAVERDTRTMVFWTFFPLVPPHIDDSHHHLDRCHRSET